MTLHNDLLQAFQQHESTGSIPAGEIRNILEKYRPDNVMELSLNALREHITKRPIHADDSYAANRVYFKALEDWIKVRDSWVLLIQTRSAKLYLEEFPRAVLYPELEA